MNTIAERIRFAMNVRNVKQVEMVQRTGITKGAFSSYLSGNYNPKKDKLELIADALDININWLMGENVPMENISATDITCNVNAAGLSAGTHSVDVSVSVPDGCSVSGNSSVKLTLSANQQETTVDNSSSQTQQTTTR